MWIKRRARAYVAGPGAVMVVIPPAFMPRVYSFRLSVRLFVCLFVHSFIRSLLSITFIEFTSKFLVKVSLSEDISLTTHQKAFIFGPWVPERVIFYAMSFGPRVHTKV